jgi:IPT/TIG domain
VKKATKPINYARSPNGAAGTSVTITGVTLEATKVTFGGVNASFLLVNADTVRATVPTGAKTGHIIITTPGGSVSSSGVFTVP